MKAQFDNQVMSSFYLWFDHTLLSRGEAFTNFSSALYDAKDMFLGYHTYGAPFKQLVADSSISGANIVNTVVLNGNITNRGQSSFEAINYSRGHFYFTSAVANPSTSLVASYAVKDFNVHITNDLEEKLLFETQFKLRNKTNQVADAIADNAKTYPAIFLKNNGSKNEPIEMGGGELTTIDVRAIVLSDSQFKMDAVASIFRDRAKTMIPIILDANMPFNSLGDFTDPTAPYNYTNLTQNQQTNQNTIFLENVTITKISGLSFASKANLNPDVFSMIIDFELNTLRYPRQ